MGHVDLGPLREELLVRRLNLSAQIVRTLQLTLKWTHRSEEDKRVAARTEREVQEFRREHEIQVTGRNIPKPVTNFLEVSSLVLNAIDDLAKLTCRLADELPVIHHGGDQARRLRQTESDSVPVMAHGPQWTRRRCGQCYRIRSVFFCFALPAMSELTCDRLAQERLSVLRFLP